MNEAFGMMDEGYFKPRTEILKFINDLLQLNVTKIESLGQGAVYCQIIDAMFPGKVALSKVNWKAKLEWEFVNNLKVLQTAFAKIGIKRVVEVEKLSKCKYQDNLELIQWLMRFYECNCNKPLGDYDAVARRKGVEPDFSYSDKTVIPKIFNLATNNKPTEKSDKPKKHIDINNTAGITASPTPGNKPSPKEKTINKAGIPSKVAIIPQQVAGQDIGASDQLEKIKLIVIDQTQSESEKISAIAQILGLNNEINSNEDEERKEDYNENQPLHQQEQQQQQQKENEEEIL